MLLCTDGRSAFVQQLQRYMNLQLLDAAHILHLPSVQHTDEALCCCYAGWVLAEACVCLVALQEQGGTAHWP